MTTARSVSGDRRGISARVRRFLSDAKWILMPPRRMTTAERRELQRQAAKDPNVERALQELFVKRPELRRRRDAESGGIQGRRS